MLDTVQRRFQYQLAKITSIGTLIGASSILIKNFNIIVFFYVIPFIAICFDLLITAESFNIRRLSDFIYKEKKKIKDIEYRWEKYVRDNPGSFASISNYLFSIIIGGGCILILLISKKNWIKDIYNIIWLILLIVSIVLYIYFDRRIRKK